MLYICNMRDILFKYLDRNYYINDYGDIIRDNGLHEYIHPYYFHNELEDIFGIKSIKKYLKEWIKLSGNLDELSDNYWEPPFPIGITMTAGTFATEIVSLQPMSPPNHDTWLQDWLDLYAKHSEGQQYIGGVDVGYSGDSYTISEIRHEIDGDTVIVDVDLEKTRGIETIELDFTIGESDTFDGSDDIYKERE